MVYSNVFIENIVDFIRQLCYLLKSIGFFEYKVSTYYYFDQNIFMKVVSYEKIVYTISYFFYG